MKKLTRRQFTAAGIIAALGVTTSFIPGCNEPTAVYGPPPINPSDNEVVDVYGPPEDFDPEENEPVAVYGPPEDFGLEEPIDDEDEAEGE